MIVEIKKRLLKIVILFLLVFFCLVPMANDIYLMVSQPLLINLPTGNMIATGVTTPLFIPIKLIFYVAWLLIAPFVIYQFWAFFAPAFYKHERRRVYPLVLLSVTLFYAGIAFAYYVVYPSVFKLFAHAAPKGVVVSTDIASFLEFAVTIAFTFAISFLIPVFICGVCMLGIVTRAQLVKKRAYVVVFAFTMGLLFTPPDVVSQFLLAIPICFLFELGLLLSFLFVRKKVIHNDPEIEVS